MTRQGETPVIAIGETTTTSDHLQPKQCSHFVVNKRIYRLFGLGHTILRITALVST